LNFIIFVLFLKFFFLKDKMNEIHYKDNNTQKNRISNNQKDKQRHTAPQIKEIQHNISIQQQKTSNNKSKSHLQQNNDK